MVVKLRSELLGGHVHVRLFTGEDSDHLASCGTLVFRKEEWPEFVAGMKTGMTPGGSFTVLVDGHGAAKAPA